MKCALITGATGQDGAYLARILLDRGYDVTGTCRPGCEGDTARLRATGAADALRLVPLDITITEDVVRLVTELEPHEVYNLAAQSRVDRSFAEPLRTADVDAMGPLRLLEAIRTRSPETRFFQASSAEMFGRIRPPQDEGTPFRPRSPYAVAKLFAHEQTATYREVHGIFACCGILFNHESPLRSERFVTRKISAAVAHIRRGKLDCLRIGNLDARRDWGYAADYAEAMWLTLQQALPDDYVLATGQEHSVREFVETAFAAAGLRIEWRGSGREEHAVDRANGQTLVRVADEFFRPADDHVLCGDAGRARRRLGWEPRVAFADLVSLMVHADLERQEEEAEEIVDEC